MSIGPSKKEVFGITIVNQVQHVVSNVTKTYFSDPLYYLFYGMLMVTILALFVGWSFSGVYYSILSILASTQLWKFYISLNDKPHAK